MIAWRRACKGGKARTYPHSDSEPMQGGSKSGWSRQRRQHPWLDERPRRQRVAAPQEGCRYGAWQVVERPQFVEIHALPLLRRHGCLAFIHRRLVLGESFRKQFVERLVIGLQERLEFFREVFFNRIELVGRLAHRVPHVGTKGLGQPRQPLVEELLLELLP